MARQTKYVRFIFVTKLASQDGWNGSPYKYEYSEPVLREESEPLYQQYISELEESGYNIGEDGNGGHDSAGNYAQVIRQSITQKWIRSLA